MSMRRAARSKTPTQKPEGGKHKHYGRVNHKKKKRQESKARVEAEKRRRALGVACAIAGAAAIGYFAVLFRETLVEAVVFWQQPLLLLCCGVIIMLMASYKSSGFLRTHNLSKEEIKHQREIAAKPKPVHEISLKGRSLPRVPPFLFSDNLSATLLLLNLSMNSIEELPRELGSLISLKELNVSRNYLRALIPELCQLLKLTKLDASSNNLRSGSLHLDALAKLKDLQELDLRFNNKLGEPRHAAALNASLQHVECLTTLKKPPAEQVHAADRDATLLRSQIAPHATGVLRRRLSLVFNETTDPASVPREEMVERLLAHYEKAGPRKVRIVLGTPVSEPLCAALLAELEKWAREDERRTVPRERLTIDAQHYMIVSAPGAFGDEQSAKAARARVKLASHARLWDLAKQVLLEVDPDFAKRYTAVAFTKNFQGSPHIDTQNTGPFYGLALGDFSRGGGYLCVECSAREIAHVDTRNRLGRVDGRFPHWVSPYAEGTRFSVIYYQTQGEVIPRTTAVFSGEPMVQDPPTFCKNEDNYHNKYCRETNTYTPSS